MRQTEIRKLGWPDNLLTELGFNNPDWEKPHDLIPSLNYVLYGLMIGNEEKYRNLILLIFKDGKSFSEIADMDNNGIAMAKSSYRYRQIETKALRIIRRKYSRHIIQGISSLLTEGDFAKTQLMLYKNNLIKINEDTENKLEEETEIQETDGEISIDYFGFPTRTYNCLRRAGIDTIDDLISKSPEELLKLRNMGKRSLLDMINILDSYGIKYDGKRKLINLINKDIV